MVRFDFDATFGDDYLHFYQPYFTEDLNVAEVDDVLAVLVEPDGASILDAPCGHGRLSNLLAQRGFRMTGLDRATRFLDRGRESARALGVEVRYVAGDLRALPFGAVFDATICWFTSFGYFDDDENRRVLAEFRRTLRPGGRLIIETLHHDAFVRSFSRTPASSVTRAGEDLLIDETDFDPLTGRFETDRTIVRDGEVRRSHHSVRLPTPPEFDAWLTGAGFGTVEFVGRGGQSVSLDAWRLVVIAS